MSTFAAASPPGGNGFIPPLGISKSAAGICAAVFLLGSVLALKDFRMSNRYRMSFLFAMGAASKIELNAKIVVTPCCQLTEATYQQPTTTVRGIAMALRAASISKGETSE
jgi:hypothetical protein